MFLYYLATAQPGSDQNAKSRFYCYRILGQSHDEKNKFIFSHYCNQANKKNQCNRKLDCINSHYSKQQKIKPKLDNRK